MSSSIYPLKKSFSSLVLIGALCAPFLAHAKKGELEPIIKNEPTPWFTGPLLTPSGHVIPKGHVNFEPYVYWIQNPGHFNSHWKSESQPLFTNVLTQITAQMGILEGLEFDMAPGFSYNHIHGEHMWRMSDFPIALAFQMISDSPQNWLPAIKLRLGTNIPSAKYDRLNPHKLETDAAGVGNWLPSIGLVLTRTFHLKGVHFLAWRFWANYGVSTPVSVHGLSVYGGAPTVGSFRGTRGTVYPGNLLTLMQGLELSLSRNWVLALDLEYEHRNRRRFSGRSPHGTKPKGPSTERFGIAPGIEYNFNANIGVVAGPWIVVKGRNSIDFVSWTFAVNIYN